ncbi:APP2 [Symbiodinium sp. CCMP2456]|nr:APP2 [Symbiodinium sp. CCMP2456]
MFDNGRLPYLVDAQMHGRLGRPVALLRDGVARAQQVHWILGHGTSKTKGSAGSCMRACFCVQAISSAHRICRSSKQAKSRICSASASCGSTCRDELENRLSKFRETLIQSNLQAYIIPTDDAHMSEVPPDCFARRRFLTGFSGSAGTALVSPTEAMLWTDGRYFIQAKMELSSSWKLMKSGIDGTPDLGDWLLQNLRQGDLVGIDPSVHAALPTLELQSKLRKAGIDLRCVEVNLVDQIWKRGRSWPSSPVRLHPQAVAGASASEKLKGVRQKMAEQGADVVLVTALDEVAYLFNIRGGDVRHTPVVLAFALVDMEGASIFVDDGKVTREVRKYLEDLRVEVNPYASFGQAVSERVQSGQRVWMDTKRSNYSLFLASGQEGPAVTKRSPVAEMQACKNQAEIKGMVEAHRRDGAALCCAFAQLEAMLKRGEVVTEIDVDRVVTASRAAVPGFLERSFDTIAGYGPNAAIIHYVAQAESAATVGTDSMLLLDSGAQYHDGTTDVTRTLKFGLPTSRERELFTRVLKAHIGLATATFPADVPCFVLDAYATGLDRSEAALVLAASIQAIQLPRWQLITAMAPGTGWERSLEPVLFAVMLLAGQRGSLQVGTAIVIHAGNMITAEKHAAMEEAEGFHEDVTGVTFQVFVEVVVGSLLALWGGIGDFKPIRASDPKKPRWESLHARPDFHSYRTRAKFMRSLLTNIESPP